MNKEALRFALAHAEPISYHNLYGRRSPAPASRSESDGVWGGGLGRALGRWIEAQPPIPSAARGTIFEADWLDGSSPTIR